MGRNFLNLISMQFNFETGSDPLGSRVLFFKSCPIRLFRALRGILMATEMVMEWECANGVPKSWEKKDLRWLRF
jgi:hypothetical protein